MELTGFALAMVVLGVVTVFTVALAVVGLLIDRSAARREEWPAPRSHHAPLGAEHRGDR